MDTHAPGLEFSVNAASRLSARPHRRPPRLSACARGDRLAGGSDHEEGAEPALEVTARRSRGAGGGRHPSSLPRSSPKLGLSLASSPAAPRSLRLRRVPFILGKLRGNERTTKKEALGRWGGTRSCGDPGPAGVSLACKGLVCSSEIHGGFEVCEKGSGVVLGFFHWTHTYTLPQSGAGVRLGVAQAHPTSLGFLICSEEKKQRTSAEPLPGCPGIATLGLSPGGQAAQPPEPGRESAPLWLECAASHLELHNL